MKKAEIAEIKKDCFGYDPQHNNCKVLKELCCKREECGFYKSKERFKQDKEKYGFIVHK